MCHLYAHADKTVNSHILAAIVVRIRRRRKLTPKSKNKTSRNLLPLDKFIEEVVGYHITLFFVEKSF